MKPPRTQPAPGRLGPMAGVPSRDFGMHMNVQAKAKRNPDGSMADQGVGGVGGAFADDTDAAQPTGPAAFPTDEEAS